MWTDEISSSLPPKLFPQLLSQCLGCFQEVSVPADIPSVQSTAIYYSGNLHPYAAQNCARLIEQLLHLLNIFPS